MTKVLLVEDDNNLREIYEARLAAEGYDIVTAKDGEDALAVAKQHKPELIISDVMMPRISGFEMLDILRNTDGLKNVKVIMLTALGQSEDKTRADSLGADRYLVKSQVTLEDIVKAAEELLNPDAAEEETEEATPAVTEPAPTAPVTEQAAPAPELAVQEPTSASPVPETEPELPTIGGNAAPVQPEVTLPPVEPQPQQQPAETVQPSQNEAAPAPAVEQQPALETQVSTDQQQVSPVASQPEPQVVQPAQALEPTAEPSQAAPETEQQQPTPEVQPTPATEPHTVIQPDTQGQGTTPEQQAPEAQQVAPAPVVEEPPVQPATNTEPQVVQPAPAPEPTAEPSQAAPETNDNGISVVESPNLDVTQPYPGATEEAEPKIQMPHSDVDATPNVEAQSVSQEEATVEQQIDEFVNSHQDPTASTAATSEPFPTQQVAEPSSEPVANQDAQGNEAVIEEAVNNLTAATTPEADQQPEPQATQPAQPEPAPTPTTLATEPAPQNVQQIPGKKIIQPISTSNQGPDIHTLAAQEEIKENLEKGVTGAAVVSADPNPQPAQAPAPGVTPVPQTPQQPATQKPGGVFTPNSNGDANMTAL